MAKMNSTSLYVTTNQIILKSNPNNPSSWYDLYRLVPYLRNSLCCVVCGNLLVEPMTPAGKCQHHLCKKCRGGRKKIKPACMWCKDCKLYADNKPLRSLLQCYKEMCTMLINSGIFKGLIEQASTNPPLTGVERGAGNLIMLIKEGAAFQDEYHSSAGLSKSVYSILPCVYTNSATQTLKVTAGEHPKSVVLNTNIRNVSNGTALYSVMYAGSGNKITIKRKSKDLADSKTQKNNTQKKDSSDKEVFKKPSGKCPLKTRRGCRCGNATATPGKLTCCGQRCPCYVEGKACIDCKCRGCRNPHRPDGNKVRPTIQPIPQYQPQQQQHTPVLQNLKIETFEQLNEHFKNSSMKVLGCYTKVPTSLPQTVFMHEGDDDDDDDEITVDV